VGRRLSERAGRHFLTPGLRPMALGHRSSSAGAVVNFATRDESIAMYIAVVLFSTFTSIRWSHVCRCPRRGFRVRLRAAGRLIIVLPGRHTQFLLVGALAIIIVMRC